jgi:hypothetical protein
MRRAQRMHAAGAASAGGQLAVRPARSALPPALGQQRRRSACRLPPAQRRALAMQRMPTPAAARRNTLLLHEVFGSTNILSYILFWMIFYNLCHIF